MTIQTGGRIVASTDFSDAETAWRIGDADAVLTYLEQQQKIVLGGDVLTEELTHTYDSWYDCAVPGRNHADAVRDSVARARTYLSDYMNANGKAFYVIFVVV
ncbi:MAG: hypothetical protein IJY28_04920 [Clostridia bacterium]|nr:hypothetical protein [Clostridia bacterium]